MFLYAAAAAVGTFGYSLLLPAASPAALIVAAAWCVAALALNACIMPVPPFALADIRDGMLLFAIFAGYQFALREALKETLLSLAVVNVNICMIAVYNIARTRDYAAAPPLFSACLLYLLLGVYIAYFTSSEPSKK